MSEVKLYELRVENVDLLEGREGETLFTASVETKRSILNYLTTQVLSDLLKQHNIEVPNGILLGGIIEFYTEADEPYVVTGHEGDDYGNIKTVNQLEVYWKEVA